VSETKDEGTNVSETKDEGTNVEIEMAKAGKCNCLWCKEWRRRHQEESVIEQL
jgi:hypothetical protein